MSHIADVELVTVSPRVWDTKITRKIAKQTNKTRVTVFAWRQTVTVHSEFIVARVAKKSCHAAKP
jgi:hypothetical protein